MVKKKARKKSTHADPKRTQRIVLALVSVAAIGAIGLMIMVFPKKNTELSGVGANGYSVFEKKGADLGILKVASKKVITDALGKNAKSVDDPSKSGVLSMNGNLGQTATFPLVLANGEKASIDVDVLEYKSKDAYDSDGLTKGTGVSGRVDGREVRYMTASTIGRDRIYALLVTKDLKSYKFQLSQPSSKIAIREYLAHDVLKKVIDNSNL